METNKCHLLIEEESKGKMKVLLTKTSDYHYREIREIDNLEGFIDELLEEDFKYFTPEIIVSKPYQLDSDEIKRTCKYRIEIYDTYRE